MTTLTQSVELYMTTPVLTVREDESLKTCHERLSGHRISCLAVVNQQGKPSGVVTRTDMLQAGRVAAGRRPKSALLQLPDGKVADVMTKTLVSVSLDSSVGDAAKLMVERHMHRIFVMVDDRLVGVLSTKDVMVAIGEAKLAMPISEAMSAPVFTVRTDEPIALAAERLEMARIGGLVVLEEGTPVGVFTQLESLLAASLPRDTMIEDAMSPSMVCMDVSTPLHRAAAQAAAASARRVVVLERHQMKGILSGLDFARAACAHG